MQQADVAVPLHLFEMKQRITMRCFNQPLEPSWSYSMLYHTRPVEQLERVILDITFMLGSFSTVVSGAINWTLGSLSVESCRTWYQ